jgi:hypothetical protein
MPRYSLLAFLLLALVVASSASAADKSSGDNAHARLTCFSILSPGAAHGQTTARRGWMPKSSCDAMCDAQGGACVGTGGFGGMGHECAEVPPAQAVLAACRCCAVRQ